MPTSFFKEKEPNPIEDIRISVYGLERSVDNISHEQSEIKSALHKQNKELMIALRFVANALFYIGLGVVCLLAKIFGWV